MNNKILALAMIEEYDGERSFLQFYVNSEHIVAMFEDEKDENCCYISLTNGNLYHINISLDDLRSMLNH